MVFYERTTTELCKQESGLDADKELAYRQQAANLIQDMGQRLQVYPFRDCGVKVLFLLSHVLKMCISDDPTGFSSIK